MRTVVLIGVLFSHKYAYANFPKDFIWGVATAAHQVEGDNTNSDWYVWENRKESLGASGAACDFWRRYSSDFDIVSSMGLNSFRLSIEWSRVEPKPGEFDIIAIDHYRSMLMDAQAKGLKTMVTLHHFTTPLWLANSGGWISEKAPQAFKKYTERVVADLGPYIDFWNTINEPNVVVMTGYMIGVSPPGKKDVKLAFQAYARLIEAHAYAYRAIHAVYPKAQVGLAHHMRVFEPSGNSNVLDHLMTNWVSAFWNEQILNAIKTGEINLHFGPMFRVKRFIPGLKGSLDFLGINYYSRDKIRFTTREPTFFTIDTVPKNASTDVGWEIYPEGIKTVVQSVKKYGWPIYITENGIADASDSMRPKFICDHLRALESAIDAGANVKGYYHWSIYDNFEWSLGYGPKFGLFSVDFVTQERTARPSAYLYSEIAKSNSLDTACGRFSN